MDVVSYSIITALCMCAFSCMFYAAPSCDSFLIGVPLMIGGLLGI